jgi:hypothetical protein
MEWDISTLQKARACYGGQSDTAWGSLIRKNSKQQKALLEEGSESESENYDSESDAEPEDKDPSYISQERGDWTHEHISKPRILTTATAILGL